MKTLFIALFLWLSSSSVLLAQKTVLIKPELSTIGWTGHAQIGSYAPAGTLNFSEGKLTVTGEKVTSAQLTIDMNSMQQSNQDLLGHLKSEDFFDVAKYPVSVIKITKIYNGKASGLLTIKNKTLPFECPVTTLNQGTKLTVSGSTTIDRTKYNIIYNSGSFFSGLGDKAISNMFDVTFKVVAEL